MEDREPYQGQWLFSCRSQTYDWGSVYAVVVSGDTWNPCGHAMLRVGMETFHIGGLRHQPYHLSHPGYQRYLKENGKRELRSDRVHIPYPDLAQAKLDELTSRPWLWAVVAHNCASFVEEVVQAGGAKRVGLYLNCPRAEIFK
jgi:hypothetical protein